LVKCGQGGIPAGCEFTQGAHFAPRFGFAFQPFNNPNTVIRGGYGVFYDQLTGNDTNPKNIGGNAPVYLTSTATNTIGYGSITRRATDQLPWSCSTPTTATRWRRSFSLGFQREMRGNNRVSVNYVGTLVKAQPAQHFPITGSDWLQYRQCAGLWPKPPIAIRRVTAMCNRT